MKSILKLICLSVLFIGSTSSFAQNILSANDALGSGSWGPQASTSGTSASEDPDAPVQAGPGVALTQACGAADQNFMPHRGFLNLFQNKSLKINHSPTSGEISISGSGMMISNCNSMLQARVEPPANGRPYLFHVEIKKPAGCTDLCKYNVDVAEDPDLPSVKTGTKSIEVAPTYAGFMQCLRETGVLNENNERDNSKIVASTFKHTQSGITKTDDLAFYSRGPMTALMTPKFGSLDKIKGGRCDTFEKIAKDGFRIHSKEDVTLARKEVLFDEICAGGDYKAIDRHLPDFREFSTMYSILKNVRDSYLLDEVKGLHTELKQNDYSELDAERFRNIILDFKEKIIEPLKVDIANLYDDLKRSGNRQERARLQNLLDRKVAKLIAYNKSPYLTSGDLESMKSFAKNAPLQKEAWREAAITLYSSNNSAFHYARYGEKSDLPKISISATNREIEGDLEIEAKFINQLGQLAANPEKSFARDYNSQAQALRETQAQNGQALQQFIQQEQMYAQNHCMNPRKYWINRQKCIQGVQENIQAASIGVNQFNQALSPEIARYQTLSTQWGQIEAIRAGGTGVQPNPRDVMGNQQWGQFSFDPRQFQQNQNQQIGQQQGFPQQGMPPTYQQYLQQSGGRMPGAIPGQGQFPMNGPPQYPNQGPGVYPSMPAPGQFPQGNGFNQNYGNAGMSYQYQFGRP